MLKTLKTFALFSALVLLSACGATGPKYAEYEQKIAPVQQDHGRIYIYRILSLGWAVQPEVKLNGEVVGTAVPNGFFYVDRPAGNYEILTSTEVDRKLTLTLESGQTRYVRLGISAGFFVGHVYPELVEPSVGAREIQETQYTGGPLQESSPSDAITAATATASDVSGKKEVSESIPTITVAIFPFSRSLEGNFNDANFLLPAFAHQYISENRQLRLSASYYEDKQTKIGNKTDYWSPTSRPLVSRIFSDGARIDVDVILMYSYSGKYTIDDRFDVTAYLFDVRNRRSYELSGDENNYKQITEDLFKKVTAIQ